MVLLLALGAIAAAADLTEAPERLDSDWALGLGDDCQAYDDPELVARLDRRTDSVERGGNRAVLLVDGERAFSRRRENARDADVILMKSYIFSEDEVGRNVARQLMARARDGAVVIVQYDLKGSLDYGEELAGAVDLSPDVRWLGDKPMMREMSEAGVLVIPTNVPRRAIQIASQIKRGALLADLEQLTPVQQVTNKVNFVRFDHEKYWVTGHFQDGELVYRAILGGMNVASEYAYGGTERVDRGTGRTGWRDTDVEVSGPVTLDVVERYLQVLEHNLLARVPDELRQRLMPEQPAAGSARVRFVWNQPALGNNRRIERLYRTLIRATPPGEVVRIASAYFAPGWRIYRPLERHLDHGRLAVVTNSADSMDVPLIHQASRDRYRALLKRSPHAALFEWRSRPEMGWTGLHSKVASFGTCGPVIVGSANLDGLSSEHNSESVLVIRSSDFRREFDAMFEADLAPDSAERLGAEVLEGAPWRTRVWQRIVYRLGWTWL